jgi:hypothetical protein
LSTHNCLPACFDRQSWIKCLKNENAFTRDFQLENLINRWQPIFGSLIQIFKDTISRQSSCAGIHFQYNTSILYLCCKSCGKIHNISKPARKFDQSMTTNFRITYTNFQRHNSRTDFLVIIWRD